jgi:hypothetical protein
MRPEERIDRGSNIFKNALHPEEGQPAMIMQWSLYMIPIKITLMRPVQNVGGRHRQKRRSGNFWMGEPN